MLDRSYRDVRFGSKMCSAPTHVRFTTNSDIDCVFRRYANGCATPSVEEPPKSKGLALDDAVIPSMACVTLDGVALAHVCYAKPARTYVPVRSTAGQRE